MPSLNGIANDLSRLSAEATDHHARLREADAPVEVRAWLILAAAQLRLAAQSVRKADDRCRYCQPGDNVCPECDRAIAAEQLGAL